MTSGGVLMLILSLPIVLSLEKLEIETWNWNLNIQIEHSQLLKYVCFRFVNIAQFNMVKEALDWMVFGPFWLPADGFWV